MATYKAHEFHMGSPIYTADGQKVGRLRFVVADPETYDLLYLVIEKGMLLSRDVLAPQELIREVKKSGIVLNASPEQVQELPDFVEARYLPARAAAAASPREEGPPLPARPLRRRHRFSRN
jgi:uncharacterized protein YrrD